MEKVRKNDSVILDAKTYQQLLKYENQLEKLTMREIVEKTSSIFQIAACRAGNDDCKKNWTVNYYEEGRCKTFVGEAKRSIDIGKILNPKKFFD